MTPTARYTIVLIGSDGGLHWIGYTERAHVDAWLESNPDKPAIIVETDGAATVECRP